ncbi:glycogen synthase [Salmonella enterica]|uniref:Surface composition regulator n=4 Tax=Salmonella enterica TaxID=28901 RepID=A0A3Y9C4S6_SALEB|nr:glycogen synthase [Salmonella enterica subsp. enterica serovar Java]EAA3226644.1 glycogen synthase [Salmonella enterica subsp. enterica serovar Newport]EAN9728432.1 glycogen synthase [Salmonella enterica]EBU8672982.1 glycogen synthase [Salmonella enterica subsp. enterica serovar Panama]EBV8394056.1 glycogen synthase [Salmonella enterica subsp. enterica serovar Virchow]EBV8523201.1 glycogen synthase [Salmonella enterica subsp. enterica serovar Larochelle]EBW7446923.1 glycogen synthase [Salm
MKKSTDIYAFSNFEFLAITFAQMTVQGREINMDAVTGNMDEKQREWFLARYRFWLASYAGNAGETDKNDIIR